MAKVIDQYIDPATGTFQFTVEDAHGVRSEHAVVLDSDTVVETHIQQTLDERDARSKAIDALSKSLKVRIGK